MKLQLRTLVLLLMIAVFIAIALPKPATAPSTPEPPKPPELVTKPIKVIAYPSYGHAVAINGIHSIAEALRYYPDLDISKAHFEVTKHTLISHVSYLKNGKVYFTKSLHVYPAGTEIITDGKVIILARCGNELTDVPPPADTPDEPKDLDEIVPNPEVTPDLLLPPEIPTTYQTSYIPPMNLVPPDNSIYTPYTLVPACCFSSFIPTPPITPPTIISTPEPSTFVLLLIGLVIFLVVSFVYSVRKDL